MRIRSVVLAVASTLALILVACGGGEDEAADASSPSGVSTAEATASPTTPATEPSATPTPTVAATAATPSQEGSLNGAIASPYESSTTS